MEDYFAVGFTIIAAVVGLGIGGVTAYLFYKDVIAKDGKDNEKSDDASTAYVAPGNLA